MARALEKRLAAADSPEIDTLRELSGTLEHALLQTRFMARGLFPVPLQEDSLAAALEELAAGATRLFGISVESSANQQADLDSITATHLYQIAREAVTNAVRHGGARRVAIELSGEERGVVLSVKDDGCGIPDSTHRVAGVGLRSMEQRAREMGAELSLVTLPEGGTRVECCLDRRWHSRAAGTAGGDE